MPTRGASSPDQVGRKRANDRRGAAAVLSGDAGWTGSVGDIGGVGVSFTDASMGDAVVWRSWVSMDM